MINGNSYSPTIEENRLKITDKKNRPIYLRMPKWDNCVKLFHLASKLIQIKEHFVSKKIDLEVKKKKIIETYDSINLKQCESITVRFPGE